jgi:fructose-1,6-bisphosphatase II / sedoheptulose-1,7-bisphosphatase
MLYIGEEVGAGVTKGKGPKVDIALDPLEGTTICAVGGPNALAVIAMAEEGGFLNAPDVYMQKIAVGKGLPENFLDIDEPMDSFLPRLAKAKNMKVEELCICVLDRDRHTDLIADIRAAGARIILIGDGDVSGVIATTTEGTGVDAYIGTGGAPEGVLAAAALQCIGGQMKGRLLFRNDDERARAERWGITDFDKVYDMDEMAFGENVMFAATGVTDGTMLKGVKRYSGGAETHSIVMRSKSGTVRDIKATHNFTRKVGFAPVDQ